MLGLSTKTLYAVSAIYALDRCEDNTVMKIQDIADTAKIPKNFLEQILLELKKNKILTSVKGPRGGYRLSLSLKEITLAMIIEILEDNYFVDDVLTDHEVLKSFWHNVTNDIHKAYDIKLSELQKHYKQINNIVDFSI